MNTWFLLSHTLSSKTPGYGGQNGFNKTIQSSITQGRSSNSEYWELSNHIGTHVDCPYHFSEQGNKITNYEANDWIFTNCFLIEYEAAPNEVFDLKEIRNLIPLYTDLLIIKTCFQNFREEKSYHQENPGLSPELGKWLKINRPNVSIVGFDFISLTAFQHRDIGRIAHQSFLTPEKNHPGIRIIEDMKLSQLQQHPKLVIVSPLFVNESDGSPVTIWCNE